MSDFDDDDDWGAGFDDVSESVEPEPADPFEVDVSTVDAQDTVDVSAEFFRVCARIYPENPVHAPVYAWLASLPRTGKGNIRSISDHLVFALRLYVDALNSGASLQLQATSPASGSSASVGSGFSAVRDRYSASRVSPSARYQQSRRLQEALHRDLPLARNREDGASADKATSTDAGAPSSARSSSSSGVPDRPGSPAASTGAPSSSGASGPAAKPRLPDVEGLSYVARLARDDEGWT